MDLDQLLQSNRDIPKMVNMSPRAIRSLRAKGRFPKPVDVDGRIRFRRADIEAWVANLPTKESAR